jgi:hypothetical protein
VLSSLMNKLKTSKGIKPNKSRAHSSYSEYRALSKYPKAKRISYQKFKRSVSRESNNHPSSKKNTISKHERSAKTMVTSSSIANSRQLSRNSSSSTIKVFQSHLLNPAKSSRTCDKKQWLPKKFHKKSN